MRAKDFDDYQYSLDLETSEGGTNSLQASVKRCFYEVLFSLFHSSQTPAKISDKKKLTHVVLNVLQSVQLVSILSIARNDLDLWDSYGVYLDFLQYLRVDFIFMEIGLSHFLYYFADGLIFTSMLLFCLLLLLAYYEKPFPELIRKTTSFFFALHAKFLTVPILIIFLKLSIFSYREEEYEGILINLFLALLSLFSFLFINCIYILGSSDIRHCAHSFCLESRTTSFIDIKKLQVRLGILSFYVLQGSSQVFYLSIIMFLGEGFVSYKYYSMNVHYNEFATKTKIACSLFVSLSGFAMILGELTANAGVFILVNYLANPLALIAGIWYVSGKLKLKGSRSKLRQLAETPEVVKNSLEVEHILRPFLMDKSLEYKDLVLSAFDRYFNSSYRAKDASLVVWEAYYCLNCLKDERLSRIKMSKRMYTQFSFEGDYQAFLYLKRMRLDIDNRNEDLDFLHFRIRLNENKRKDRILCENFLLLFEQLTEASPNGQLVGNLVTHIGENLLIISDEYNDLCTHYNRNKELLILYQTYLSELMRDKEKANYIYQRHGTRNITLERTLNWFDEENSFLIISGELSSLGTITYANANASELFEESTLSIIGKNIDEYIPSPMNLTHNKYLHRFLFFCKDTKINSPRSTLLKNSKGFVIEVYAKIRCLAIDSYPMFLFLFKAKHKNREIVMVDTEGYIQEYSVNIPSILRSKSKNLHGMNINDILTIYASYRCIEDISYYVLFKHKIFFHQKKIFSMTVNLYRFHPREYTYVRTIRSPKRSSGGTINSRQNINIEINDKSNRRIRFCHRYSQMLMESSYTINTNLTIHTSASRQRKSTYISSKAEGYIKILLFIFVIFLVASCCVVLFDSIYVYEGFDLEVSFTALYKIWNLNTSFVLISNSAANFRRTQAQTFYEIVKDHVGQFENFMHSQEEIISVFEKCNSREKIYDDLMYYWENNNIRTINLVDFANKLVKNIYDFFEQRESDQSYEFIISNCHSYPIEYLINLSDDLKTCITKLQDEYISVIQIILSTAFCSLITIFGFLTYVLIKIRQYSMAYWNLMVNVLSLTFTKLQNSLRSRLEEMHSVESMVNLKNSLKKRKWSIPPLSIWGYIWFPVVLICTGAVIFSLYIFILRIGAVDAARVRLNSVEYIGKLNFYTQKLDYWTREAMFEDMPLVNTSHPQPFKNPQQKLKEIQKVLKETVNVFNIKKSIYLLGNEKELFYDRVEHNGFKAINGIYGQVKILLTDSIYYSGITDHRDSEYDKFNSLILKLTELQEKVHFDSIDLSLNQSRDIEIWNIFIKLLVTIPGLCIVSVKYVKFSREERKRIKNKNTIFKILNNIPVESEITKGH